MDVSVAMATYNGRAYVEAQLESILDQSKPPAEIVIVDDNSTDGTMDILRSYEQQYPDVFDVSQNSENLGVSRNFEKCIRGCSGDAIAFSDQDDVWKPMKLERQCEILETVDAAVVFHDSEIVSTDQEPISRTWAEISYQHGVARDPTAAVRSLVRRNFAWGSTMLFNASLTNEILPFPDHWAHDYYMAFYGAATGTLYDVDEPLNLYRRHEEQDSGQLTGSVFERLRRGIAGGFDSMDFAAREEQWDALHRQFRQMDERKLAVDKDALLDTIATRRKYEACRGKIYSPEEGTGSGLRALTSNLLSGRYRQFGDVPTPFYVVKDATACVS